MLVSACIITYNQEKFIESCLEGVINQKVDFDYEIIIGDDFSNDRTSDICLKYAQKYPELIKYSKREKNLGMTGNWVETISNCSGKYIALCEGDDYWTDFLKLQKQVDFLKKESDYVLCFHDVEILNEKKELVSDTITNVPDNYENIETLARLGNYIHTPTVVFRNVIKEFPEEFKKTPIADYFLYIILAQYGKIKHIKEKMAVYRYGAGVFSSVNSIRKAKANIKLFTTLLSYSSNKKLKEVFLKRQEQAILNLVYAIEIKEKEDFYSKHYLLKILKNNFRKL